MVCYLVYLVLTQSLTSKSIANIKFRLYPRSSAASIPLNIETQTDKLGNNPVVANFLRPLGQQSDRMVVQGFILRC